MTNIIAICGVGIYAVFVLAVIKELKREYAPYLVLGVLVTVSLFIIPEIGNAVSFIKECAEYTGNLYTETILKALGIAYLCSSANDICKAAGEGNIGGYIESAGKVEILALCLPLFRELFELAVLN